MKGRNLAIAVLFTGLLAAPLSARQESPPRGRVVDPGILASLAVLELEPSDPKALLAAERLRPKPGPLRIAEPRSVSVTPAAHGSWTPLPHGARLWQLRIHAPGATDLNFGITTFRLPPGATFHVWSEADGYYEGPYTSRDHKRHGQLWTPLVPGDRAVLELYLPAGAADPELELTHVGVGFRDAFGGLLSAAGDCNVDVVCPEADGWRDQIQGVARYTLDGVVLCSGSLINDARSSRRPFFLTAFHCGADAINARTMVVYWNFHSPRCGQLAGGSLADNQTGATYVAGNARLDGSLLELDELPDASFGAFYNGWDRSGSTPQGGVGIHHPQGDEKAISFAADPLGRCDGFGLPDHWRVRWDLGTTEPGSSGSPLFDPERHRIVGFLTGGDASCENSAGEDCYGPTAKFFALPAVSKALGARKKRPQVVDGLESRCDCSDPAAIVGTDGDDALRGTSGADILCGLGGNDTLRGRGGRDCLEGGAGDDDLRGGRGKDALHGGEGEDVCNGGGGQDSAGGCEVSRKVP